jgi:hypothetical protein
MPENRSPQTAAAQATAALAGLPADAAGHLRAILVAGETIEACAVERRVYALTHRRMVVAATSGRFIALQRRLLGGFDPQDIRWQDLQEVQINVGLLGADLTLSAESRTDLAIERSGPRVLQFGGLQPAMAQAVYRACQAQAQAWREKRRIRELEELRARSGALQWPAGAAAAGPEAATGHPDAMRESLAERLRQAREMREAGLITDAEYEAIKARIINSV